MSNSETFALPSFSVRNFGPIEDGTVRLHPLTILIGKNNTGKTYMAQAIYAAYKALERADGPVQPAITVRELEELADALQTGINDDDDLLRGSLREKVEVWINSRLDRASRAMEGRLSVYFDLNQVDELQRWHSHKPINFSVTLESSQFETVSLFGLGAKDSKRHVSVPALTSQNVHYSTIADLVKDLALRSPLLVVADSNRRWINTSSTLVDMSLWDLLFLPSVGLDGTACYLPAGRSGLLESWTDLITLRLRHERDRFALTGKATTALGGIALDFLSQLQAYTHPYLQRGRLYRMNYGSFPSRDELDLILENMQGLLNGRIASGGADGRVPLLTYVQDGKTIPVQRASAMVAELAPLLTWIDGRLLPGDLLIIDEPEAHMHPEAVLAVAEALVALSHYGVKVLCTTHSSDFLHQISNCILRSKADSSKPHGKNHVIGSNDVGVYRFYRPDVTSDVQIVAEKIDPEWGIPEEEYVAVAQRLTEETADLVDSLR